MRYGDKDGFNEIYDDKGELILHPNEKILVVEENVVPSFKSTWRYYGGEYLLEPSKGTMILTNERLVFINIPERMFAIGGSDETRAMNAPMESNFELGDLSPGAAVREYFEVPNIEIMASEKKEGAVSVGVMVNVFILSSGNQFHLSMVLTSDSDLLMRLMNKKVESLDTLVNNLKDFFRRTDWMFMEGEKKLYGSIQKDEESSLRPDVKAKAPTNKPKDTGPAAGNEKVMRSFPTPQIRTDRKIRPNSEVTSRSIEYFENLYHKGLIKEDIYRKLISQYRASNPNPTTPVQPRVERIPKSSRDDKKAPDQAVPYQEADAGNDQSLDPEIHHAEELDSAEPVIPGPDDGDDDDLLNMLNSTLSDLSDGSVSPPPVDPDRGNGANEGSGPIRAKKVHRVK